MHGKDAVIEEILDWRPYDYVTDRTILATPDGPLRVLHTIELEPTATGTTIHMRYAAPKAKREMPLMEVIGPAYGEALQANCPSLASQLAAAFAQLRTRLDRSPRCRCQRRTGPCPPSGRWRLSTRVRATDYPVRRGCARGSAPCENLADAAQRNPRGTRSR